MTPRGTWAGRHERMKILRPPAPSSVSSLQVLGITRPRENWEVLYRGIAAISMRRPARAAHPYGAGLLEAVTDFRKHRRATFALDVRAGERLGHLEVSREAGALQREAGAGGGRRLASGPILFPGRAEIVEPVG